jgi:tripartite-type tricarboxylate transporter receptor subunit TctC
MKTRPGYRNCINGILNAAFALTLALLGLLAVPAANAQTYPTKPVRMIVPFPPGGATDIIARLLSQKLHEMWGQPVVLEYKPGGGTVIGTDAVAKAAPDGYTVGVVISAHFINPSMLSNMPFDTVKDLSGVSTVAISHIVLVATPSLQANNISELIALAKKNPGKLTYASPGTGTSAHLAVELLKTMAGIDIVHIPYKGASAAFADVLSGRVSLQIDPLQSSMSNIKSGKVKALAITSPHRAAGFDDIPTVAETIPGFSMQSVSGVVVASATPRDIVHKLSADINKALQSPDLIERMRQMGMEPSGDTPEEFDAMVRSEIDKWAKVVKASGAKVD